MRNSGFSAKSKFSTFIKVQYQTERGSTFKSATSHTGKPLKVMCRNITLDKNFSADKTMKVQSFEYMLTVYGGNRNIEPEDLEERKSLLSKYKYSVIIEGSHIEFDNLNTWVNQQISTNPLKEIYYGKTDYDYGFAEFFLNEKIDIEKLKFAVKNIYTTWGNETISKSDGSSIIDVPYSPDDKDAIVYPYDEDA